MDNFFPWQHWNSQRMFAWRVARSVLSEIESAVVTPHDRFVLRGLINWATTTPDKRYHTELKTRFDSWLAHQLSANFFITNAVIDFVTNTARILDQHIVCEDLWMWLEPLCRYSPNILPIVQQLEFFHRLEDARAAARDNCLAFEAAWMTHDRTCALEILYGGLDTK
jgi:hypothetical protein